MNRELDQLIDQSVSFFRASDCQQWVCDGIRQCFKTQNCITGLGSTSLQETITAFLHLLEGDKGGTILSHKNIPGKVCISLTKRQSIHKTSLLVLGSGNAGKSCQHGQ